VLCSFCLRVNVPDLSTATCPWHSHSSLRKLSSLHDTSPSLKVDGFYRDRTTPLPDWRRWVK
jgi:hypothetical protein